MKARSFTGARMPLRAEQSFRAINSALRSALGRIEEGDHPGRRRRGIVQGFVTGLGSRGVGFLVSFLSVPLTIGYLGKERYGVWILLSSLLAWVRLTDLGISNGLRSAIASALGSGRPDLARAHISTAFALLSTIAAAVGLVAAVAWPWIDWVALFGITTEEARAEVGPAIATSFGFFLLVFPLSITARHLRGPAGGQASELLGHGRQYRQPGGPNCRHTHPWQPSSPGSSRIWHRSNRERSQRRLVVRALQAPLCASASSRSNIFRSKAPAGWGYILSNSNSSSRLSSKPAISLLQNLPVPPTSHRTA